MVTRSIEAEIIQLVADERGLPRQNIQLSDRLLQDLGMDGDDAVDFFISVRERFGTDLTHLREHWSEHFSSEGTGCWGALVVIPLGIIGGLIAIFTRSKVWGAVVALALFAILVWMMHLRRPGEALVRITVGDVVAAAETGTWPE